MRTMRVTKHPNGESSRQDRPPLAVMPALPMPAPPMPAPPMPAPCMPAPPPCLPPPCLPPPCMPPRSMPPRSMPPPSRPPPSRPPPSRPPPSRPPPSRPPPSRPPPSRPPPSMPPPSMPPRSMPPRSMPPPRAPPRAVRTRINKMLVLTEDEVPRVAREEEVHTIDLWKMPLPPSKQITILQEIHLNPMPPPPMPPQPMPPPPPPAAGPKVIAVAPTPASKPILIVSWTIGGIRMPEKRRGVQELLASNADIICLQEVRCGLQDLPSEFIQLDAYHQYWSEARPGYSGCSCWSKEMPKGVETGIGKTKMDPQGRIITVEFANFFLITVNVPSAGRNLVRLDKRMEWNLKFERYCKKLDKIKPLIIIGNMKVAHAEQDLARPRINHKSGGFSFHERKWMTNFLLSGFIDTFRHLKPIDVAYTFWTSKGKARANNVGWRLDYAIVSKRIIDKVTDCSMWRNVRGSTHCPIAMMIWKP